MKTAEALNDKGIFIIKFTTRDREEWGSILGLVKQLPGREFHTVGKYWTAPILPEVRRVLIAAEFDFIGGVPEVVEEQNNSEWKKVKINKELIPGLRPYQYTAIKFLLHRKGRGLIADEMGTGKTVMGLSWAKYKNLFPILIIVPATIKIQWRREYRKWKDKKENIEILSGKTPHPLSKKTSYIINWDILSNWVKELLKIDFTLVIGDEIQAIGNPKSLRSKAFKSLGKKAPEIVPLSGTPIRSNPRQFFPILNLLSPALFPNEWKYLHRYCGPKHNGFGWDYKGCTNGEELHDLVSKVMIRRSKEDVVKDLPKMTKVVVPLDDVSLAVYLKLEEKMKDEFAITTNKNRLKQMFDDLANSAFEAKKKSVVKWIETFIATGEKLLVGAYHRKVVEFLSDVFKTQCVTIYGKTTSSQREKAKENFINNENVRMLIGNIQSAGVGIDGLQKVCSNSATVELCWTPTDHEQFEARLHRIGQPSSVTSYYLLAPDTVEEEIAELIDQKYRSINQVVDGKEVEEADLLQNLLELRKAS